MSTGSSFSATVGSAARPEHSVNPQAAAVVDHPVRASNPGAQRVCFYEPAPYVETGGLRGFSVDRALSPEPARQFRVDRELMRNEHASPPYLAPIAPLIPRTLAVDFTHDLVDRGYLFQTMLDGVPAPDGLARYPRAEWASFFRQIGTIARSIHAVCGAWSPDQRSPAGAMR